MQATTTTKYCRQTQPDYTPGRSITLFVIMIGALRIRVVRRKVAEYLGMKGKNNV